MGIREQGFLRRAATNAGFVTRANAHSNIQFVSEAEASVHFCMFHSDLHEHMNMGVYFVVCDAGGSTTDTTAYYVKQTYPTLELDETKASACVQAGGVSVDAEFHQYLCSILDQIDLSEDQRNEFIRSGEEFRINLGGGRSMNYPNLHISRGKLALTNDTISSFFNESVEIAIESIRQQMDKGCEHVLLVGGFGESLYLRKMVNSHFSGARCSITVTSDPNAKAVADGSVLWCAKRTVVSRATRMAYGSRSLPPTIAIMLITVAGKPIVSKDTVMEANEALRGEYHRSYDNSNPALGNFSVTLYGYKGAGSNTNTWKIENSCLEKGFEEVCQIQADLSGMRKGLKKQKGTKGKYYRLDFKVAIQFGDTEMKAFLEWEHGGKTFTGPAEILPNELSVTTV
ncbi:ATP binding [Rhizoctonia solani]|uniref:ATP binding n=1 Tax=Rhizoctonia solani TaxID=456999 RepID=A0A8H7I1J1_9AGAM|nr:ATP binding [Rhizoctonia solani]